MVDVDKALAHAPGLPYWFLERISELGIEFIWCHPDELGRRQTRTENVHPKPPLEPAHGMNKPFPRARQRPRDAFYMPMAWEEGASEQGFPRCCGLMATP